jgi:CheY-like chemotaxis protein
MNFLPNGDIKKRFGTSVKFWRHQLGISQEALAERAGVHRTYVCDVERGSRNVSLEVIEKLSRALQVSTASLFPNRRAKASGRVLAGKELVEILFVEDNADDATLTMCALKEARLANHVELVRDGAAALDFLFCRGKYAWRQPHQMPDLVLLDLNLPKVSGLEVLRQMKSHPETRSIPVVVLTVSRRSVDVADSQRLGAKAYIVKPVSFQNFSEVVPKLNLQLGVFNPEAVMGA